MEQQQQQQKKRSVEQSIEKWGEEKKKLKWKFHCFTNVCMDKSISCQKKANAVFILFKAKTYERSVYAVHVFI